jgi:hypothetical protein
MGEQMTETNAVPREVAARLCERIRHEQRSRWYTFNGLWCWGCATFAGGDVAKRCWASREDGRGCAQVNARYDREREVPDT